MTVPRSDYTDAIERELTFWPGVSWRFEKRAKHNAVVVTWRNYTQFCVFPASGSDRRGALNQIADLRALLRRMGAQRIESEKAPAEQNKPYRPAPPPPAPRPPAISDPRADGFAPLRQLRGRLIDDALARWDGVRANPERLEDAAHALIAAWHPDIITRAADLIKERGEDTCKTTRQSPR